MARRQQPDDESMTDEQPTQPDATPEPRYFDAYSRVTAEEGAFPGHQMVEARTGVTGDPAPASEENPA